MARLITLPTWLTIGRVFLFVPIAFCVTTNRPVSAAIFFCLAALTDFLDGYFARRNQSTSALGATLDPIADKIVVVGTLVTMVSTPLISGIHIIPVLTILLREFTVSGIREAAAGQISLPVTLLAKIKTSLQFLAVLAVLVLGGPIAVGLLWASAALTLWTGGRYFSHWLDAMRG